MIFLTVGSQMPFDRLAQAVDRWAATQAPGTVFGQIGRTDWRPQHYACCEALTPAEFKQRVAACELLVGHAGMGTVLTALEHGKPMLLLPRLGALQETRNDHQVATLRWLADKPGIGAAMDEPALLAALEAWSRKRGDARPTQAAPPPARAQLVGFLRGFIEG